MGDTEKQKYMTIGNTIYDPLYKEHHKDLHQQHEKIKSKANSFFHIKENFSNKSYKKANNISNHKQQLRRLHKQNSQIKSKVPTIFEGI